VNLDERPLRYFYFVRHGQSDWNAIGRMQGQMNSDLSALGRQQARTNGRLLATLDLEAIYASPLDRARQTAEIIQDQVDLDVAYDDRIMEWDCGDWSGQLRSHVERRWPVEWAALHADPFHYRGPKCENYPDMIARATPFVEELLATPHERIAVVSHGLIGRVMIGILMGYDEAGYLGFSQPNDVVYRVGVAEEADRSVYRYAAGRGPVPGVVDRW
jgi:broad specificity phosphatase PhoE